jgi:glycine/D-amino acid oxidase-like deaminating enzyme
VKSGASKQRRVEALTVTATPKLKVKDEEIHPEYVIVAVNAWTLATLPRLATLRSALTYACMTEPLDESVLAAIGLGERIPFYTADTPYLWGRVCKDGSVVFGAGLTFGEPNELEDVSVKGGEPAVILERLARRVTSLHPALENTRITARWGGPIAFREGAIPLLMRHPQNALIFVAGAYAGHGVAFSVHAGALIASAILDGSELPSWGGV